MMHQLRRVVATDVSRNAHHRPSCTRVQGNVPACRSAARTREVFSMAPVGLKLSRKIARKRRIPASMVQIAVHSLSKRMPRQSISHSHPSKMQLSHTPQRAHPRTKAPRRRPWTPTSHPSSMHGHDSPSQSV